ncbi:SubName: Full=Probable dis1-suppressing protein kinase dsk1 {ECO:0000313/EMBL:CCA67077.1} [Serendipita indica DSM 11827]|uniref:non-specific serine/threonine protein kinase n=1 Tax=Serendipita indica (strain DSM 11827) TaxID=1109443 RepID=G4T706_SERID|nr:SubName: Full=Probable dis1-suppressing protein kinase dsk1 {ECO:0000313/EMBL:CCA67077.1} [Serendipita indica DSM 11827]CCA67077.1 probable dis1-suppressing protein kinase dsk1 [Serendipita indica DSM 11827]
MEEECPNDYIVKGGYLRVALGDKLGPQGRYLVKRKLGWGVFSTVWLAEDTLRNVHVALKICRSDRDTRETAEAEIKILKEVMWHGHSQSNIVRLVDTFCVPAHQRNSRAEHACLVFEILGPNLLTFLEAHIKNVREANAGAIPGPSNGLPLQLVKEFAKQMLAGTAYLHDFCRYIHTDLKPENIVIALPDIERIIHRDLEITTPSSSLVETTQSSMRAPAANDKPSIVGTSPSDSNTQVVEIYDSQPIPTPIYRLTTPRTSYDENDSDPSSSGRSDSSGSSNGGDRKLRVAKHATASVASSSIMSSSDAVRSSIDNHTADSHQQTGTQPTMIPKSVAIAVPTAAVSPSSPITSTFASFSRRLSSSFSSLSFPSWPFARSPPTRDPLPPIPSQTALPEAAVNDSAVHEQSAEATDPAQPTPPPRKVLPELNIKIVDFGNAQPISESYVGRIQTRQYRAPEVILGRRDWDRKVDVWSIACIIFELVTGDFLFDPPEDSANRDKDHIYQILELTNPFYDRRWAMGGRMSGKIFTPNGDADRRLRYYSLQSLLEERYHLETSEAKGLADFLIPMLAFEPYKRANARDLVDHPWLEGTRPIKPFPPDDLENFQSIEINI